MEWFKIFIKGEKKLLQEIVKNKTLQVYKEIFCPTTSLPSKLKSVESFPEQ